MKFRYLFLVKKDSTAEDALSELEPLLDDIYEMEDPETGSIHIGGYADQELPTLTHSTLETSESATEPNWEEQWSHFAPHFHNGCAHIDLGPATLLLKPGGGFGDLSHPTTRLVLSLMESNVKDKVVFDIGCGSGILSVAAALLGAKQVYGIDIEEEAIKHSQENAALNQVETKTTFSKEMDPSWIPKEPFVIVMNMIESEQKAAWESLIPFHKETASRLENLTMITSGILASQKERYLKLAKSWGWSPIHEREEEGWVGFVFRPFSPQSSN